MNTKFLRLKTAMRAVVLMLMLVVIGITRGVAERVTPEVARNVAMTFFNNNGVKSSTVTDISKAAGFTNLYIFNAENGFVILSADDRAKPILGYSLTGKFVTANMPENLRGWLQGYDDEIQYAVDNNLRSSTEIMQEWKDLKNGKSGVARAITVVEKLIQTTWDQSPYYNAICPLNATAGELAVTGCVATAMAQIMKYWNYPVHGIGSHTYTPESYPTEYGQQYANFGATTYDWINMPNSLMSSSSTTQINAVATLMYHCGVSVEMDYDYYEPNSIHTGSGAVTADVAEALKYYFDYSSNIQYKIKSEYTNSEWISLLKEELDNNRPLQYEGSDVEGHGGHSFVCDGYDNNDNFHFNWGWSGYCDGFYSINNMNPNPNASATGSGNGAYTLNQAAIFGIQPANHNCSAPTNLSAVVNNNNVTLTWTAAEGVESYRIYRDEVLIESAVTGTSYTDIDLELGDYMYYLKSNCSDESTSAASNTVIAEVDFPGNITATIGNLRYSLNTQKHVAQVIGHQANYLYEGTLLIPSSVTYSNEEYTVTSIGNNAFPYYHFTGSLSIPNTVTTIGQRAFDSCRGFTGSLTIPNSVTAIGQSAFSGCSGFTGSLTIGNSVTTIGDDAFSSCSGFTGSLTIGNSVTTIGESAFENCSGFMDLLTIGNSVTTIENDAFCGCGFSGSLTIPNSVIIIGERAFYGCGFTGSLIIGNSVTTIENGAFCGCGFSGSLTIGRSVTTMGVNGAFYGCSFNGLFVDMIEIPVALYSKFSGCSFSGSLTIGNSVITIGDMAFYGCNGFTGSLTIGDSVTTIGESAFENCSGFTGSMTIGNSVTIIGESAFKNCSGFTGSLTIENSVTIIGESAFENCSGFTGSLTIPNSVTTINGLAFSGCSGFTGSLTIPNSVTTIGYSAFIDCSGFSGSLLIGNSVTTIGNHAFSGCSGFTDLLTIPNSVTSIDGHAFEGCSGFTGSLTIGNSVTSIGNSAFSGCSGLTTVNWNAINVINYPDVFPFAGCSIISVVFGDQVQSIPAYAFYDYSDLKTLTIGDSVTTIGYGAFYYCNGLTGVLTIPNSVTSIGDWAFTNCRKLTGTLTIPSSVTSIGRSAFGKCSGLTALEIGNSVTDIGVSAFNGCSGIAHIIINCETCPIIYQNTFYGIDKFIYVKVPCGTQDEYKSAQYWSEFENIHETEYSLIVTRNDEYGGEVSVFKWADCDDNHCKILAEPNLGYTFNGWYVNDVFVSGLELYEFSLTEDVTFEARFTRNENHHIASGTSNTWSNPDTWDTGEVPTETSTVAIYKSIVVDVDANVSAMGIYEDNSITITSNVVLTVEDELVSDNASSIIIEDGGQIIHSNEDVMATVEKTIEPFTSDDDGWNLVSFPLIDNGTVASVANMLSNEYDLYAYDEPSYTWINQKDDNNDFTELEAGNGYLYANKGEGVGVMGTKIGTGTSKIDYTPFYTYYNYSISENLFLASELEAAGLSTSELGALCWYATNQTGYQQSNISIWMANVSDTELTETSHNASEMTLVYTGDMTPEVGWNEFVFNENTFTWDGASNILVCVQRNNGAYNSSIYWQAHDSGFNAMSYIYNDDNSYDMTTETYSMSLSSSSRPNTIFQTLEQVGEFENYEPITMSFAGEIENGTAEITVPLSYTIGNKLSGFNLVGNPFVHNVTYYDGYNVADGCYRINDAKTNLIVSTISNENPLKVGEGFFVKATGDNASITFNSPTRKGIDERGFLRMELIENDKVIDRLIVKKDGEQLQKMSLRGSHTELFARNNSERLSIVPMQGAEQPVSFKAVRMGSYTITVDIEYLDVDYLHLIDNFTGKDVDLLIEPQYTFVGASDDSENRFRLVFDKSANVNNSEIFAYQNGNEIIVSGNGTLQIFDVMGRMVAIQQINGVGRWRTTSETGVYIFKLNGKTQKIVIK